MKKLLVFGIVLSLMPFALAQKEEGGDTGSVAVNGARPGTVQDFTPPEANRVVYLQGFDDITNMPGWDLINHSNPIGTTGYFQGNPAVFTAQAGADDAYLGVNYNSTAGIGIISNWALTPVLDFSSVQTFSFWTRTGTGSVYPDRLEVRLSTNGASSNVGATANDVGDFTTILVSVNPTLAVGGYPESWTQFTIDHVDLGEGTGRIAFRYFVDDAGPSGNNSNFIGIDSVETTDRVIQDPVPTLGQWGMIIFVGSLIMVSLFVMRRRTNG